MAHHRNGLFQRDIPEEIWYLLRCDGTIHPIHIPDAKMFTGSDEYTALGIVVLPPVIIVRRLFGLNALDYRRTKEYQVARSPQAASGSRNYLLPVCNT